jgi:hypothetical protein
MAQTVMARTSMLLESMTRGSERAWIRGERPGATQRICPDPPPQLKLHELCGLIDGFPVIVLFIEKIKLVERRIQSRGDPMRQPERRIVFSLFNRGHL